MRNFNHTLTRSKSGKTVFLKVDIDDRFGQQTMKFSTVHGWRSKMALKHLFFEREDWDDEVARKFVGLEALKSARDPHEGLIFINQVKELSKFEVHFWASKFLSESKTSRAWRSFYS